MSKHIRRNIFNKGTNLTLSLWQSYLMINDNNSWTLEAKKSVLKKRDFPRSNSNRQVNLLWRITIYLGQIIETSSTIFFCLSKQMFSEYMFLFLQIPSPTNHTRARRFCHSEREKRLRNRNVAYRLFYQRTGPSRLNWITKKN